MSPTSWIQFELSVYRRRNLTLKCAGDLAQLIDQEEGGLTITAHRFRRYAS